MEKFKVGLVLGGGGARGFAHIGILKVLEAFNIKIDVITGTSMGGLVGAMYAQNPDAKQVEKRIRDFLNSEAFKRAGKNYFKQQQNLEPTDLLQQLTHEIKKRVVINLAAHRQSLMKGERLKLAVTELIAEGNIEDTQIPFACSATDLHYGQKVVFDKGDIRFALTASAAIPGFIPPMNDNGRLLVDGSVCDNFPVETARKMGANFIIVSNVSMQIDPAIQLRNVIDIVIRANAVSTFHIDKLLLKTADCVLRPETGNIHWSEFEKYDELVGKGVAAAEKEIERLQKMLKKRSTIIGRLKYELYKSLDDWRKIQ